MSEYTSRYLDVCYNLGPAEIVEIKADSFTQLKKPEEPMQICAFLWTYYGYPVCEYEGKNVDQMRYDSGLAMGHKDDTEISGGQLMRMCTSFAPQSKRSLTLSRN